MICHFIEQVRMLVTSLSYQAWELIFVLRSIVKTSKCTTTVLLDSIHHFRLVTVEAMARAGPVLLQYSQVTSCTHGDYLVSLEVISSKSVVMNYFSDIILLA